MKPTNYCLKRREKKEWGLWQYNGGGKLTQSILYMSMELPQ